MPKIITAIPHITEPLAWQRLYVLLGKGDIRRTPSVSQDALESVGLSGYHMTTIKALRSWASCGVPPSAVICLRILREEQRPDGGWSRRAGIGVNETGLALRYLHLALEAGETPSSDVYCAKALRWLEEVVRDDGILPFPESDDVDLARPGYFSYLLWAYDIDAPEFRRKMDDFLPQALITTYGWATAWPAPTEPLSASEINDLDQLLMALAGAAGLTPASRAMKDVALHLVVRGLPKRFSEVSGNQAQKIRTLFYYVWSLDAIAAANTTVTGPEREEIRAFISGAQGALCQLIRNHLPDDANTLSYALRALLIQPVADAGPLRARSDVARRLVGAQAEELTSVADRYAGTLQLGLGVLAYARSGGAEEWLWALNPSPPETIARSPGLPEAAFAALPHRVTLRVVDRFRQGRWLENFFGALIGLFIGLQILNQPQLGSAIQRHPLTVFWILAIGNMMWLTVRRAGNRKDAASGPVLSAVFTLGILILAGSVAVPTGLLGAGLLLAGSGNLSLDDSPLETQPWHRLLPMLAVIIMIPLAISRLTGLLGSEILTGMIAAVSTGLLLPNLMNNSPHHAAHAGVRLRMIVPILACTAAGLLLATASSRNYRESLDQVMLLLLIIDMVNFATDQSGWARRIGR